MTDLIKPLAELIHKRQVQKAFDNLLFLIDFGTRRTSVFAGTDFGAFLETVDERSGVTHGRLLARAYTDLNKDAEKGYLWLAYQHLGKKESMVVPTQWGEFDPSSGRKRILGLQLNLDSAITKPKLSSNQEGDILAAVVSAMSGVVVAERDRVPVATRGEVRQYQDEDAARVSG